MRYRWVIFDLDGTLTDSGEGIKNSTVYALERLGLPVPADSELRKMVGPPLSVGFSLLGVPEAQIGDAIRFYREQYNDGDGKYQNRVYPGIEDCLKRLRGAGLRLCVGTSKPEPLAREIARGRSAPLRRHLEAGAACARDPFGFFSRAVLCVHRGRDL